MKKTIYFRKVYYFFLAFILSLIISCQPSKTAYISDLQNFINKVEKEYPNYTDKDWEKTTIDYEKISNARFQEIESSLTIEEREKVSDLFDRYQACRVKASLKDIKNGIKSGLNRANKFIENIISDTTIINH